MTITTYTELVSAVTEWLAREQDTTLIARIPDFITLAEAKFNRELRCMQMEKRSTALVDIDSDEPEFISLPGDFQSMRRIRLNGVAGKPRLEFLSGVQADEFRSSIGDVPGCPRCFTVFGDELELIPTPDGSYALEMIYRACLPPLGATNATNWLLTLAPDLYLYGALLESAPYIKDDSRIATWTAGLSFALNGLNALSAERAAGVGPLVVSVSGVTP